MQAGGAIGLDANGCCGQDQGVSKPTRTRKTPANRPAAAAISRGSQPEQTGVLRSWLLGGLIVAAAVAIYIPAFRAGFIWDDDFYVLDNPQVVQPGHLAELWFSQHQVISQYYPLTMTGFWLEYRLWGRDHPAGYHVVNVLLHALGCLLLWRVLVRLAVPGAWWGAMLFALHPVCVATVAWIAELKNVLSLVLAMLAVLAYLRFEQSSRPRRWAWYGGAVLMFLLAMLSKTAIMPLAVLAVWRIGWREGRVRWRPLWQAAPFVVVAAGLAVVTVCCERGMTSNADILETNWADRVTVAGRAAWFYLSKAAWPIDLMVVYPRWRIDSTKAMSYVPLAGVVISAVGVWLVRRRLWGRSLGLALGFYLLTLLPVLGFVPIAFMGFSWVADHWQYFPLGGLCALAGAAIDWFCRRGPAWRMSGTAVSLAVLGAFFIATWQRAAIYENSLKLWTDNLDKNDQAWIAYRNRGAYFNQQGHYDQAIADFNQLVALLPQRAMAYFERGVVHGQNKYLDKAIADYTKAITIDRGYVAAYNNRGNANIRKGNYDGAIADCTKAIELDPQYAAAYDNRGSAYFRKGDNDRAIADCSKAIELDPRYVPAYGNRGNAYSSQGDNDRAISDFTKAIELDPRNAEAYSNRGVAYMSLGQVDRALADFDKAVELGPSDPVNYNNRAVAYDRKGEQDRAIADCNRAIELDPKMAAAYESRAEAFFHKKDYARAWADVDACRRLKGEIDAKFLESLRKESGRAD